jgi:MEDS: MEthanogen/methylotroph, DcmR Sensory domain
MINAPKTEAGHFHAVKFYENRESLCRIVAEFLGEGLILKQPALVIATPEHRDGILRELRYRHFDIEQVHETGDLLLLDASQELGQFMVDGMPDADRFNENAVRAIERLCAGRQDCTIRAYGEMVDVLWKAGQEIASIRLEMLWNKLAMTHKFSLLCGYAMGSFYKDTHLEEIHQQHSHVVSGNGLAVNARTSAIN